ncbi:MAG: M48 family metalloprotease [Candidatus Sumerlaeota bacterium]|nr:M48 family metalloprotease [Candidatus Sumerlaeota bacterium]
MKRFVLPLIPLAALALFFACQEINKGLQTGLKVAGQTHVVNPQYTESLAKTSDAFAKTIEDLSPMQEYYIGRAVAACLLQTYKPCDNPRANEYLNVMGRAIAAESERPETYGGYHFLILDTDEVNAFAAPGGLILVSRGLLRCCKNEDDVAAVLAHEISHVAKMHGLRAIKQSRLKNALIVTGTEAARTANFHADLVQDFQYAIFDIKDALMGGYAPNQEFEADATAVTDLQGIGYNPEGLRQMIGELQKRQKPGDKGFAKTHPSPEERLNKLNAILPASGETPTVTARDTRFKEALAGI